MPSVASVSPYSPPNSSSRPRAIDLQQFRQFGAGLARLQQKLGIDDDLVLLARLQRLQLDAQRLVFRVLRMPRIRDRSRTSSRMRQRLQHTRHIKRLGREIVIAGNAVGIDAAGLRVAHVAQHARRQRHLEAHQLRHARAGIAAVEGSGRNDRRHSRPATAHSCRPDRAGGSPLRPWHWRCCRSPR